MEMIKEKIKNIDLKDKIVEDIFDILESKFNIHLDRASGNVLEKKYVWKPYKTGFQRNGIFGVYA